MVANDTFVDAAHHMHLALAQGPAVVRRKNLARQALLLAPARHVFDHAVAIVEQIQHPGIIGKNFPGVMFDDGVRLIERNANLQIGVQLVDELHFLVVLCQLQLRQAQLHFMILAIRDVGGGADETGEFSFLADIRFAGVMHIAVLAVRAPQAVLHLEGFPLLESVVKRFHAVIHVIGVQGRIPGLAPHLRIVRIAADEFLPARVGEDDLAFGIGEPQHHRGIFGDDAEIGFLDGKLILGQTRPGYGFYFVPIHDGSLCQGKAHKRCGEADVRRTRMRLRYLGLVPADTQDNVALSPG
jgi:hypothetical protein